MAAFFVGIMRKKSRLKLFCIGVDHLKGVVVVAQNTKLLVSAKSQVPRAKQSIQGRRLRGSVQVERDVRVVFVAWLGFFTLVLLVVFCTE